VQSLTRPAPASDRHGCHTPYICLNAANSSPVHVPASDDLLFRLCGVPVFHRRVLPVPRNNRADRRLAIVPATNISARCGSLIAWAKQLGRNDCAGILQKTLDEEKTTDQKLSMLADSKVNLRAAS
jgi:Domain of unknown function (DUF892)